MKTLFVLMLFLVFSYIQGQGQTFLKEFGKIAKDEIELKKYLSDPEAEAVVLFDIGRSYFIETSNSFEVEFERATRIKVLSEAGIHWSEVEIPFYREGDIYEKVYEIEAFTYNYENGVLNKTQLDLSNTFVEKKNEYWSYMKFAMPNVKEGSIIEYRYKINSQYKFNFRDWEFQWKIPVVFSQYETDMIPFYEYAYILQGSKKFDIYESYEDKGMPRKFGSTDRSGNNSYHDMIYKFGMKNVPAFKDEEFITSSEDYIIKIDFQLARIHNLDGTKVEVMTNWEEMIKELLKHQDFGSYVKKSEKMGPELLDLPNISQMNELEKFNFVLDYVKANYNWNNYQDNFASKTPNKLVSEKRGNCADLNLFTVGLLNSMGIEAYPIVLSTRDHGKINLDYPFLSFFNYVIIYAKIEGKILLADATEILSLNDRIPVRCINDKGLIIKKEGVEWVDLNRSYISTITTYFESTFKDEGSLLTEIQNKSTEYDALNYRNNYTDKIDIIKPKLDQINYSIIDSTIKVKNQTDKTKPYVLRYCLTTKPEIVNNKIYISPFLNETLSDNPLKQLFRVYPIDLTYPKRRIFICSISTLKGYKVDFLPGELKINNDLMELNYSAKVTEDKILVSFDYLFKQAIYQSIDYVKIKSYFDQIVKKGNEKIVFVKDSPQQL